MHRNLDDLRCSYTFMHWSVQKDAGWTDTPVQFLISCVQPWDLPPCCTLPRDCALGACVNQPKILCIPRTLGWKPVSKEGSICCTTLSAEWLFFSMTVERREAISDGNCICEEMFTFPKMVTPLILRIPDPWYQEFFSTFCAWFQITWRTTDAPYVHNFKCTCLYTHVHQLFCIFSMCPGVSLKWKNEAPVSSVISEVAWCFEFKIVSAVCKSDFTCHPWKLLVKFRTTVLKILISKSRLLEIYLQIINTMLAISLLCYFPADGS